MTDFEQPGGGRPEEADRTRRRRHGGREGHARSSLPSQRPWAQPRLRYAPTEPLSADELESIHVASLRVLEQIGMDFLEPESRDLLRAAGARVEPGSERVRFDPAMVEEQIRTAPSSFTLHAPNPVHDLRIGGDWLAFGSVASAPNVYDADRGRRVGNRADYQDLIRLSQVLEIVHFFAGYPVEPVDVHASVRHLHAIHDLVTLADKPIHAYSLGRQRNIDALEMMRIRRGVDDATLDREPSIFTVINSSSPLRLDTPMLQGILEFSRRNQVVVHDPLHPRRRDGPGDPRRRARGAERRGPGRDGVDPGGAAGRPGRLRRVHEQRGHAIGRAGVRDAGVHADGHDRRPAGPSLRRAVSLVQRVGRERRRCPGGLRERLQPVGRDHGWCQPAHAWRRLDGGGAPCRVREADPRRGPARDGRGLPGSRGRGRRDARLLGHGGNRTRRSLLRGRAHAVALPDGVPQADAQRLAELGGLGGGGIPAGRRQGESALEGAPRRLPAAPDRPGHRRASSRPSSTVASPRAASRPISDHSQRGVA